MAGSSWGRQHAARRRVAERFGPIHSLPVAKRIRDVLRREAQGASRVLEVGAGEHALAREVAAERPGVAYESVDPDPSSRHDHASLDTVTGGWDVVCAFEVVEHLPVEEIEPWLARLASLLAPGGRLLLSTPNTFHPPAWLRDATHRTPLCYDELGGLVERAGLRVTSIHRVYHDSFLRGAARRYLFGWLFRLLSLDYARQVLVVAERPPAAPSPPA